jgi:hypothetical protein
MRSAHRLHGVLYVTPFASLVGVATVLAVKRIPRGLRDGLESVFLEHLPRDGVNLDLGYHGVSLMFRQTEAAGTGGRWDALQTTKPTAAFQPTAHNPAPFRKKPVSEAVGAQNSSSPGGSNQLVSDRPPSTTIAAPVT